MSQISKEILQHIGESFFKDIAIKQDSKTYYFHLSFNVPSGNALGNTTEIDIKDIINDIQNYPDHMVQISIADAFMGKTPTVPPALDKPVYIRFPGLYTNTRYNFVVGPGINNFNSANTITLPCGDLPKNFITCEYGIITWDNRIQEQTQQSVFLDAGTSQGYYEINIRFKVQTITLK